MNASESQCGYVLRCVMGAVAILMASAASAWGTFDVPDSCRVGSGSYDGHYMGEASFSTCINADGEERLSLKFDGDLAPAFTNVPGYTAAGVAPDDLGNIDVNRDSPTVGTNNRLELDARFEGCTIIGTWKLTNLATQEVKNGSFTMQGTGNNGGPSCSSAPSGGGGEGICALFGGLGIVQLTFVGGWTLAALGRRRLAIRTSRS
jgi:hypothetical protein